MIGRYDIVCLAAIFLAALGLSVMFAALGFALFLLLVPLP